MHGSICACKHTPVYILNYIPRKLMCLAKQGLQRSRNQPVAGALPQDKEQRAIPDAILGIQGYVFCIIVDCRVNILLHMLLKLAPLIRHSEMVLIT